MLLGGQGFNLFLEITDLLLLGLQVAPAAHAQLLELLPGLVILRFELFLFLEGLGELLLQLLLLLLLGLLEPRDFRAEGLALLGDVLLALLLQLLDSLVELVLNLLALLVLVLASVQDLHLVLEQLAVGLGGPELFLDGLLGVFELSEFLLRLPELGLRPALLRGG